MFVYIGHLKTTSEYNPCLPQIACNLFLPSPVLLLRMTKFVRFDAIISWFIKRLLVSFWLYIWQRSFYAHIIPWLHLEDDKTLLKVLSFHLAFKQWFTNMHLSFWFRVFGLQMLFPTYLVFSLNYILCTISGYKNLLC